MHQSHSSPDLVTLRQKLFYLNDRACDIDFSVTGVLCVRGDGCVSLKPASLGTVGTAQPAVAEGQISTRNGTWSALTWATGLSGVLKGPHREDGERCGAPADDLKCLV